MAHTETALHSHICQTCTLPYDCDSDKDDLQHCARYEWLGHDCPTCHRQFLLRQIMRNLEDAIIVSRDTDLKLSRNEEELAADWARIAVAMMSQQRQRDLKDKLTNLYESLIVGVADEVKEFNEDHSAASVINQAVDRMTHYLRQSNPMTAAMRIVRLMSGAGAW